MSASQKFKDEDGSNSEEELKILNSKSLKRKHHNTNLFVEDDANKSGMSKARRMMDKMGYTGGGLGAYEQGRLQPVSESQQKGRHGLGLKEYKGDNLNEVDVVWYEGADSVTMSMVSPEWLPLDSDMFTIPVLKEMVGWMIEGPRKESIDDETNFVDANILRQVLQCKTVFDKVEGKQLLDARTRSNPYETLKNGIFMNRAALKMAEMDAATDWMFSKADELIDGHEPLFFADICAGPGGFSEYILWRRRFGHVSATPDKLKPLNAKGYGFTLRGKCDFKLEDFHSADSECFEAHYGDDKDGDIFKKHNLLSFQRHVMLDSENRGVHFVTADGGFSVEGKENIQEILSKQLYLCQCLCALLILRKGGHFLVKVFDLFTEFSAGLLHVMRQAFEAVTIFKPLTSRPANSERYFICRSLHSRQLAQQIADYFLAVNDRLNALQGTAKDVLAIFPQDLLHETAEGRVWKDYLCQSNNSLGRCQALGLAKIRSFVEDKNLFELRQEEVRSACIANWCLGDERRRIPLKFEPSDVLSNLLRRTESSAKALLHASTNELSELPNNFIPYDHVGLVVGEASTNLTDRFKLSPLRLVYSKGRQDVLELTAESAANNGPWRRCQHQVELPRNTLVLAQFVEEFKQPKFMKKSTALLLLDAAFLGGVRVSDLSIFERHEQLERFSRLIHKPSRVDLVAIRCAPLINIHEPTSDSNMFKDLQLRLEQHTGKGFKFPPRDAIMLQPENSLFLLSGILLLRVTRDPWKMAWSRSRRALYYYDTSGQQENVFEPPPNGAASSFVSSYSERYWVPWSSPEDSSRSYNVKKLSLGVANRLSDLESAANQRQSIPKTHAHTKPF